VSARKFSNLMPFGCWWFLNNSSLVTRITRMRLEMLAATFVAQHSDARVLEQLGYKWREARRAVGEALAEVLEPVSAASREIRSGGLADTADRLLRGNFESFCHDHEPVSAVS
jgi:hypothetical protein